MHYPHLPKAEQLAIARWAKDNGGLTAREYDHWQALEDELSGVLIPDYDPKMLLPKRTKPKRGKARKLIY
jgi:hypothetical protein